MKRLMSLLLTFATVLSLFWALSLSVAAAETFSACVGNVYENIYAESYGEYINKVGANTEGMRSWEGFAWRGDETFSRIDLLTRTKAYDDVTLVKGEFVNENGDKLGKENVSFTYLDAVTLSETCLSGYGKNGQKMYDVISDETVRDMKAKSLYCAWVSMKVPEDAKPGIYTATLSVKSGDTVLAEFDYTLTVYDLVQPELESDVDLWMWPYNTIRYYSGLSTEEMYETEGCKDTIDWNIIWNTRLDEKYFPALESELELYAKAGGDVVFAMIKECNRTNGDPYPSLVKWTKKKDGTFSFDYTDFDKWVELNFKYGIDKEIKCYDLGCFYNWIVYYDEAKGKVDARDYLFSDNKFLPMFYEAFLGDFVKHLDEKGWFDITYISLDEKDYNITKMVIDAVDKHRNKDGKKLKIGTAVASYHCEELFDQIDDLSLSYGMMGAHMADIAEDRKAKGLVTTLYTCGPQGSSMINDPGESAESIHHTYKIGATGFLRWALQKYNADPYLNSHNYEESLCSGDCYLIYPSKDISNMKAYSTPRYEALCEGIRDIEKAKYLEENFTALSGEVKNAFMTAQYAQDFRDVANEYSARYLSTEIPTLNFESDNYVANKGDTVTVNFSEEALSVIESQADLHYIDNQAFKYSESGWHGEGGYFWLFLYGTNHYTSESISAASQKETSYSFTFTGDSLEIVGNTGRVYGQATVTIDGEDAGILDGYSSAGGGFSVIYSIDGLDYGEHTVEVKGCGKNAAAGGYRMQVDYALAKTHKNIEWTVGNTGVATVDENGKVTAVGAGTTTLTAKCGDFFATAKIAVSPDAEDLKLMADAAKGFDTKGYPENVKAEIDAAVALADKAVTPEEIKAAYEALEKAEAACVTGATLVSKPIMLNFVEGEYFSAKGGIIELTLANGEKMKFPTDTDMATGYNTSYAGEYTVTLTVFGKEVTYGITVSEVPNAAEAFTDVKAGQWYEDAVNYAVGHGLFNGVAGNRFAPNDVMNRGMLVTVLYRMEGSPSIDGIKNPFNDVKEKDWFYAPVLWAAENGIVGGVGSGKYAPTDSLTREQLATILFRYSSVREYDTTARGDLSAFPDEAKVSSWAVEAYSWANAEGLIGGNNIGGVAHLDPAGKATRAQVATILMRYQQGIVG